jgi:hypothetical protein
MRANDNEHHRRLGERPAFAERGTLIHHDPIKSCASSLRPNIRSFSGCLFVVNDISGVFVEAVCAGGVNEEQLRSSKRDAAVGVER